MSNLTDEIFSPGDSVEVLDYISNVWNKATVEECEEDELLVVFENGLSEWLNLKKDHIRRFNENPITDDDAVTKSSVVEQNTKQAEEVKEDHLEDNNLIWNDEDIQNTIQQVINSSAVRSDSSNEETETKRIDAGRSKKLKASHGRKLKHHSLSSARRRIDSIQSKLSRERKLRRELLRKKSLPAKNEQLLFPEAVHFDKGDVNITFSENDFTDHSEEKYGQNEKPKCRKSEIINEFGEYLYSDDDEDRWTAEIPEHVKPYVIENSDGESRTSVIIPDRNLPPGWTKHTIRRKSGNKWDVILVNEIGRVFRSRTDLRQYYRERNLSFPQEQLDFVAGKGRVPFRKEVEKRREREKLELNEYEREMDIKEKLPSFEIEGQTGLKLKLKRTGTANPGGVVSYTVQPVNDKSSAPSPLVIPKIEPGQEPPVKKGIKTLLPRVRVPSTGPKVANIDVPPMEYTPVKANNTNGFICPKKDCRKLFRREDLLIMHIKHYHREYKKLLGSTPNVADMAYARTTGQSIDSLQSDFLRKISQIEQVESQGYDQTSDIASNFIPDMRIKDESISNSSRVVIKKEPEWSESSYFGENSHSKPSSGKRTTAPTLLAQLQKPPLLPPIMSIQSGIEGLELDIGGKNEKSTKMKKINNVPNNKKVNISININNSHSTINCICGSNLESSNMIKCELCSCFQHASCAGVTGNCTRYICTLCQNPKRKRASKKYSYISSWTTSGYLPKFKFSDPDTENHEAAEKQMAEIYEKLGKLANLKNSLHSIRQKNHILKQKNHPKLYLWDKDETDQNKDKDTSMGPIPERAIDSTQCLNNLMGEIDEQLSNINLQVSYFEKTLNIDENYDEGLLECKMEYEKNRLRAIYRDATHLQNLRYSLSGKVPI